MKKRLPTRFRPRTTQTYSRLHVVRGCGTQESCCPLLSIGLYFLAIVAVAGERVRTVGTIGVLTTSITSLLALFLARSQPVFLAGATLIYAAAMFVALRRWMS